MERHPMFSLERVANVSVILMCLLVGLQAGRSWLPGAVATAVVPSSPATGYSTGESIGPVPGVDFAAADRSLVMFVRSTCGFCTASMPFYQTMVRAARTTGAKVQFVAVSPEPVETTKSYLSLHRLNGVAAAQATGFKIGGTPTLILVDSQGKLIRAWRGKAPQEAEGEIVATVLGSDGPQGSVAAER
ncbi:MAG TPA: conjugal transfer protein TraF [Vicinamibacterales bacterium]|nr:conjugal transfer protein TraF [Vicinamibacterales bacterium]